MPVPPAPIVKMHIAIVLAERGKILPSFYLWARLIVLEEKKWTSPTECRILHDAAIYSG